MQHDVQTVLQLLRSGDRFRLLTIGDTVNQPVPWVPAGTKVDVSIQAVGGISLIVGSLIAIPIKSSAGSAAPAGKRSPPAP